MNSILLADDDAELAGLLKDYLQQEGFHVELCHDGESAVAAALSGVHSIAVLDVMMPRSSGIDALGRIRAAGSRMPVLMLTAKGDDLDRILGLELGADDYVPKPCSPRELLARLRAILRRVQTNQDTKESGALYIGPLIINPGNRSAHWNSAPLMLTSTEFNILELLARNAGQVVSKSEISEQALGRPLMRFDRSMDVHVSSIRRKLGTLPDGRSYIQTVRGAGYQFIKG